MTTLKAYVKPNKFGLEPFYFDYVPFMSQVNRSIVIANPYKKDLIVEYMSQANKKFKVSVFKTAISSNSNITIGNLTFTATSPEVDYEHTIIQMQFSSGDKVNLPVYARTVNNFVDFKP